MLFENAEDEVVSIVLSAIMGNIIERWELPSHNRWSDVCSECKRVERDPKIECTHVKRESDEDRRTLLKETSISKLSEQLLSKKTTQSDNDVEEIKESKSSVRTPTNGMKESLKSKSNSLEASQKSILSSQEKSSLITEDEEQKYSFKSLFENMQNQIYGWLLLNSDMDIVIKFKNGNKYEGKLKNCRMHGLGKFIWADGSTYEGDFHLGEMTGEGCMEWSDQSWYEGQFHSGYRHGLGLYVQTPYFYCGNWSCGLRHGAGSMFYNRDSVEKDFYSGDWVKDRKQGTGVRSYPSGAMYSGQWADGCRHGLGTMVWRNNDVYIGNWEKGVIQGYGEYTWSTFVNEELAVPQENCYYGNFEQGKRHGNGTLETNLGVIVHGSWREDKKHGTAEVICSNGCFVYAEDLFVDDCISPIPGLTDLDSTVHAHQLYKVPVNAANQDIELNFNIDQLNEYVAECKRLGKSLQKPTAQSKVCTHSPAFKKPRENDNSPSKSCKIEDHLDGSFVQNEIEESSMRNMIKQFLPVLKVVYRRYAQVCCESKPSFDPILMRLMFWQLLRDCDLHNRGYSLADFDIMIANNKATLVQGVHYPFERLQFWQFLHCLIEMSWQLYGRRFEGTHSVSGVLASAFHKLITTDILPNSGHHKGSALFKHKNLLSMDAIYWFYRGLGEPLSARELLKSIFLPQSRSESYRACEYPRHLIHGRNNIGVGGKLTYTPGEAPFLPNTKFTPDPAHPHDLTCLKDIGLPDVTNCILQVCPSVAFDGLVVNMDYQVVFLEFYEILLLCAKLKVMKNHPPTSITSNTFKAKNVSQTEGETVQDQTSLNTVKSNKSTKPGVKNKKKI